MTKFLVKIGSTDRAAESEAEILEWFLHGQCFPGNFVFLTQQGTWTTVAALPAIATYFSSKPTVTIEKNIVYVMGAGVESHQEGPYSLSKIKSMLAQGILCAQSWIFVEGDKEWRQVSQVKILRELLPALPALQPSVAASVAHIQSVPQLSQVEESESLGGEFAEEQTKAFSALGLSLQPSMPSADFTPGGISLPGLNVASGTAAVAPQQPPKPNGIQPLPPAVSTPNTNDRDEGSYDGITAEIPADPIWLVKKNDSEQTMGPFRFLEVVKFIEDGKISKNDKISKIGSNRYVKILQQYEFNVKYTVETVVASGVETQKIFIRRRHPRVPYMADVQVTRQGSSSPVTCVNVSAGGILVETAKIDFKLGEVIEIKILPSLINRTISCKALVIGKIPKIPPGFALKFEDLKQEDKEAIEFFVQNALKKEQSIRA